MGPAGSRLPHCRPPTRQCEKDYIGDTHSNEVCSISGISFSPDGTRLYVGTKLFIEQHNVDTSLRRGFAEVSKI